MSKHWSYYKGRFLKAGTEVGGQDEAAAETTAFKALIDDVKIRKRCVGFIPRDYIKSRKVSLFSIGYLTMVSGKVRALVVPLISGRRSVPRSWLKKGTHSVFRSRFEKKNAFRSSFLSKGTVPLKKQTTI